MMFTPFLELDLPSLPGSAYRKSSISLQIRQRKTAPPNDKYVAHREPARKFGGRGDQLYALTFVLSACIIGATLKGSEKNG